MRPVFTPAPCQVTTITLPTFVPGSDDSYLVRFKANFGSHAEFEQAKRDGVRVEMWTNLATLGGPAGGDWHALAFEYAEHCGAGFEVESPEDVIAFLATDENDHSGEETSVYLDVHVPTSIFASWEQPRYSFTYRLVYPFGHIEWLGAFGYDGVLAFERGDARVSFTERGQVFTTDGGYIVESEARQAIGVGRLNASLMWERWSFGGKGPAFSHSHITSPSGCIILTPFPAPGSHNFVPEALKPMILTAGQAGSSLSISASGDVTFHPGVEAPYNPAGFTAVGARMLAIGKDSSVLDYDTTSDTMVVTSVTASEGMQTSPVTLSLVPLGPRSQRASHIDVRLDSQKLASVFPGSDVVLYQSTPSPQKFKVVPTSGPRVDFVTIRVKASGDKILLAPLHDLSIISRPAESDVKALDVWQLAVVSPHVSAQVVSQIHDVSSIFPTPPPSPPLRSYTLNNPLDAAPSIDSVLSAIPEEEDVEEDDVTTRPVSPSSLSRSSQDLKLRSISPSPSSVLDLPGRYVTPQIFEARPSKPSSKTTITFPTTSIHTLLQMGLAFFIHALLGRVFGFLTIMLSFLGVRTNMTTASVGMPNDIEAESENENEEPTESEMKEDVTSSSLTIVASEETLHSTDVKAKGEATVDTEEEGLSDITALDLDDEVAEDSLRASSSFGNIVADIVAPKGTSSPTSRSSYLTVGLLPDTTTLKFLVRAPSSVDEKPIYDQVSVSIDGQPVSDFSWTPIKGDFLSTYVAEVSSYTSIGAELKIAINA